MIIVICEWNEMKLKFFNHIPYLNNLYLFDGLLGEKGQTLYAVNIQDEVIDLQVYAVRT